MTKVYTRQVETVGEGDEATEIVVYQPRYTLTKFEKPAGASFNGFPAPQQGKVLERDEDKNLIIAPEPGAGEEDGEEGNSGDPRDDGSFYNPWDPPPSGHVFF